MKIKSDELKLRIAEQSLTAKELAEKTELSIATISRVLNQEQKEFSLKTVGKLARGVKCNVSDIVLI